MLQKSLTTTVLQYLMGHTDIRTTMRVYNHVDIGRVRREMNKLNTLVREKEKFTLNGSSFLEGII